MKAGKSVRAILRVSLRDAVFTLLCILLALALCVGLQIISPGEAYVPLIFALAVLVVSRYTDGYLLGFLTSMMAVLAVNFIFTEPYFKLNFSLTGYPVTFVCYFGVFVITSAMTSRVRAGERARIDGEREKMRANLLRAISHDLRTPLTSIIGALNAVIENDELLTPRERRALLCDAKADGEWLINMVENLLSITRMGADEGPPHLHEETQAAEEVMSEAVARFRKQYPDLKVEIRVPEELLLVPMDAMLIEQVIINLLINVAIHGRGATLAALSLRKEGDRAVFRVEDNGCGMDALTLEHLFDGRRASDQGDWPGDSVRTMGIGLSVCRTIVAAHGGAMTAHSPLRGGAVLSFSLPLKEENEDGTETEDPDR